MNLSVNPIPLSLSLFRVFRLLIGTTGFCCCNKTGKEKREREREVKLTSLVCCVIASKQPHNIYTNFSF